MTPERIAELRALIERGSKLPWKNNLRSVTIPETRRDGNERWFVGDECDVDLIVEGLAALPEALDAIEWVRTQCELWLHYPETIPMTLEGVARFFLAGLEGTLDADA